MDKEKLQLEITACKETLIKLEQIGKDSIEGLELNKIVLKALEDALTHSN